MYGGHRGGYGSGYGHSDYQNPNAHQQGQQSQQGQQGQNQQQYVGVNPYANYGFGAALQAPPPPPPPVSAPNQYSNAYHTYPTTNAAASAPSGSSYYGNTSSANVRSGYDQAVFDYAQQSGSSYQRQHQQNRPQQYRQGGGGTRTAKVPGAGDPQYCQVCNVSCPGLITYNDHLAGKPHKKKEAERASGLSSAGLPRNKLTYKCDLCDITCTGQDSYHAHIKGAKHLKKQKLNQSMGQAIPEDVPTIIAPTEEGFTETKAQSQWHQQAVPGSKRVIGINTIPFVGGHTLNSTGRLEEKKREVAEAVGSVGVKQPEIVVEDERVKRMMAAEVVKPIGAEYVEEDTGPTGKVVLFRCTICDCQFTDPNAKEAHIRGRRHRLSYRRKVDPSFVVETPYPVYQIVPKKRRYGGQYEDEPSAPPIRYKSVNFPGRQPRTYFRHPNADGLKMNYRDRLTVDSKYDSLDPGNEFYDNVNQFTDDIQGSFKTLSDKLYAEDNKDPSKPEIPRLLISCQKVGVFAKDTFIKGENFVEMVLKSTKPPNEELMAQIVRLFPENRLQFGMTLERSTTSPVVLLITTSLTDLKCHLTITSECLRHANANPDGIELCPDVERCRVGLKACRNLRWFSLYGRHLRSCREVVRLFRDVRFRHPVWKFLNDHLLEVIVAEIIVSANASLPRMEAFRRILEAFSAGYLLSAKVQDPCEAIGTNALEELTFEQKDQLTESAQTFLRMLGFNKIHEIFGIEKLVGPPMSPEEWRTLKRTRELMSAFHGKKLPESNIFNQEEPQNTDDGESRRDPVQEGETEEVRNEEMSEAETRREESGQEEMTTGGGGEAGQETIKMEPEASTEAEKEQPADEDEPAEKRARVEEEVVVKTEE